MPLKSTGNELVRACEHYLTLKKVFHYRNNSGAMKVREGGFIRFGAVGSPDIIAVVDGRYVGIECKMGSGRQSPAQKEFQQALEQAGGQYFLVRSIDDLIEIFDHKTYTDFTGPTGVSVGYGNGASDDSHRGT